jgi:hypothetical protein
VGALCLYRLLGGRGSGEARRWGDTACFLLASALLVAGVGLCHSLVPAHAWLGLLLAGAALVLAWGRLRCAAAYPEQRENWEYLLRGALVYAVVVGPLLLYVRCFMNWYGIPAPPMPWFRLVTIALDLDNASFPVVGKQIVTLTLLAVLFNVLLLVLAFRSRDREAPCYLLCPGVLLVAFVLNKFEAHEFQGLLFPLTAAGAVLVVQRQQQLRAPGLLRHATLALGIGLVALRAPQFRYDLDHHTRIDGNDPRCYARSDIDALERAIGGRKVNIVARSIYTSLVLMAELSHRGVNFALCEPTWGTLVGWTGWKAPPVVREGALTLIEGTAWTAPGTTLLRRPQYALVDDERALTFVLAEVPHTVEVDVAGQPCFWQGNSPSVIELRNGTGHVQQVAFAAEAAFGPGKPDLSSRTVRYSLDDAAPRQVVGRNPLWQLRIPLTVPPGRHRLLLSDADVCTHRRPGDPRDLLLLLTKLRLEPVSPSAPGMLPQTPKVSHEERLAPVPGS